MEDVTSTMKSQSNNFQNQNGHNTKAISQYNDLTFDNSDSQILDGKTDKDYN